MTQIPWYCVPVTMRAEEFLMHFSFSSFFVSSSNWLHALLIRFINQTSEQVSVCLSVCLSVRRTIGNRFLFDCFSCLFIFPPFISGSLICNEMTSVRCSGSINSCFCCIFKTWTSYSDVGGQVLIISGLLGRTGSPIPKLWILGEGQAHPGDDRGEHWGSLAILE